MDSLLVRVCAGPSYAPVISWVVYSGARYFFVPTGVDPVCMQVYAEASLEVKVSPDGLGGTGRFFLS
jgi:hypothetical protein